MLLWRKPKPKLRRSEQAERAIRDCQRTLKTESIETLGALATAFDKASPNLLEDIANTLAYSQLTGHAIRQLEACLTDPIPAATKGRRHFIISSRVLHQAFAYLPSCPDGNERMMLATGTETPDGSVVLSTLDKIKMAEQTPIYVRADQGHFGAYNMHLETGHGHRLWAMFHSHMMTGRAGTQPSQTDINHQNRLVEFGMPHVIGGICTTDGWFRLFTTAEPFSLTLFGTGAEIIEDQPREKLIKLKEQPDVHAPTSD